MTAGFVLVHGYLGGPEDLAPLARALEEDCGEGSVRSVRLHDPVGAHPPAYDLDAFTAQVAAAGDMLRRRRPLVLVGHSTGGTVALHAIASRALEVDLVVLAATPCRLDASARARWRDHDPGARPALADLGRLISSVNSAGRALRRSRAPVLALAGSADALVPPTEVRLWQRCRAEGSTDAALVPRAGHQIFTGEAGAVAVDVVRRWIADALAAPPPWLGESSRTLQAVEREAVSFLSFSPRSARHLALSPSVSRLLGRPASFPAVATCEPVFANIEVTTRCGMSCPACARTFGTPAVRDMARTEFQEVLALLPHCYRVTLVGLGEPLLHPEIDALVADAVAARRRVSLVTSAAPLTREAARAIIHAGIHHVTFSLDSGTALVAESARPGKRFAEIVENIEGFVEEVRHGSTSGGSRQPPTASVFTAVSASTAEHLESVVDLAISLGIQAVMMSDLNFEENLGSTVWRGGSAAARDGIRRAVARAQRGGAAALSVHALEDLGLQERFRERILLPPDRLWRREPLHRHCASPWQTIPICADGSATICDCLPREKIGSVLGDPLSAVWNGAVMREHRARMESDDPPASCRSCPRF